MRNTHAIVKTVKGTTHKTNSKKGDPKMKNTFNLNDSVKTFFGGKQLHGVIVGKHGSADYFAVRLENGETIYRWSSDLEK